MKTLLLLIFIFLSKIADCQTLEAIYRIENTVVSESEIGPPSVIAVLKYKGYFYRQGNQYVYFKKPLYLEQYPEGEISTQINPGHYSTYSLPLDTIQNINYKNYDSLVYRHRPDQSGRDQVGFNYIQHFEPGFQQWQLLPETKNVNGLQCQKARLTANGKLQWEVWFCADIPAQAGPSNIFDLPGLVVEGECFPLHEKISLVSYTTQSDIPASVFWPGEFDQPFQVRRAIRKLPASK